MISLIDYKIRKATEEAMKRGEKRVSMPREIIVAATQLDFISKLVRIGYKATYRGGYCVLTKAVSPEEPGVS